MELHQFCTRISLKSVEVRIQANGHEYCGAVPVLRCQESLNERPQETLDSCKEIVLISSPVEKETVVS